MFGISACGAYIPAYRLARDVIAKAAGSRSLKGEKAVASYDEDALTMGAEAAWACLENMGSSKQPIDGIVFATTTSPFGEKQAAAVLASMLDLGPSTFTADITGSLRSSLTSLQLAENVVRKASGKVLAVAADLRKGEPGSEQEQAFGDAAAALLLGRENLIATLDESFTISEDFVHTWRRGDESFVHAGDSRFVEKFGYQRLMGKAVKGLLEKAGLAAGDIAKVVLYSTDGRCDRKLAKSLGFKAEEQLIDNLFAAVGDSGNAQVYLGLVKALEQGKPGDKIVVCGYGDGAQALLLTVTPEIENRRPVKMLMNWLDRKRNLTSYQKFLKFREVLGESSYSPFSSLALLWREKTQNILLTAGKCQECGTIGFPRRRICDRCGSKDNFEEFRLARRGEVYTFTNDHVYLNPDPPLTEAVIDLVGGGRFFGQVTDVEPQDMSIGLKVQLTLRKLHDGTDLPHYFWKIRPAVGEGLEDEK